MSFRSLRAYAAIIVVMALSKEASARPAGVGPGYSSGYLSRDILGAPGQSCTQCHFFTQGSGTIELMGMPVAYLPNRVYDLTVVVSDAGQIGGGFEISVEGEFTHVGDLLLSDGTNTRFAAEGPFPPDPHYVTHTLTGYDNSRANWAGNGGSTTYALQWRAPAADQGEINVFLGALATQRNSPATADIELDHYYALHRKAFFAAPGDADADTDEDLGDFAAMQRCFDPFVGALSADCRFTDINDDGAVSLEDYAAWVGGMDDPTGSVLGGYRTANVIRGGLLYDRWWRVAGLPTPSGDHPLYPPEGMQSGSTTFRCKECHGWDYRGGDGAYGSGSHFTGVGGIVNTSRPPQAIFNILKHPPSAELINGHNMAAYGLSDADLWDLVKFTLEGVIDTRPYIGQCSISPSACDVDADCPAGQTCDADRFVGSDLFGSIWYGEACASCHDPASGIGGIGTGINFGSEADPSYVGTVAVENPWEFLHKIRFGDPGSPMPSMHLLGYSPQSAADLGAFAATLPTE